MLTDSACELEGERGNGFKILGESTWMLDAALLQFLAECAFASPGHVLRPVVRQYLLGLTVRSDGRAQRINHQRRRRAGMQA